jgi:DNA-binding NtrC family response regulator
MGNRRPRALVIDRKPEGRERIGQVLRDAGFRIAECARASEALAAVAMGRFDLAVVADRRLSDSTAPVLVHRLRRRQADIKVLVVAPPGAVATGDSSGVAIAAFPLDAHRLAAAVRALMTTEDETGETEGELCLIEAQLACLFNRRAEAEQRGAVGLTRDIIHQIDDAVAARRALQRSGSALSPH